MNRKQLAGGAISVWLDGEQTIIHHVNGLTIALTEQEAQELKAWLEEQNATWAERAEFLSQQRMEREEALPVEQAHPEYCLCDRCAADRLAFCGYED